MCREFASYSFHYYFHWNEWAKHCLTSLPFIGTTKSRYPLIPNNVAKQLDYIFLNNQFLCSDPHISNLIVFNSKLHQTICLKPLYDLLFEGKMGRGMASNVNNFLPPKTPTFGLWIGTCNHTSVQNHG